jgi:hypothetical protein
MDLTGSPRELNGNARTRRDQAAVASVTAIGLVPPPPLAMVAGHAETATKTSRSARKTIESPAREL